MRRYIKYILISLATVLLASCVKELELAPSMSDSELTTLVPRVKSFANQYITKAAYAGKETDIKTLSVLIFDNNGNLVDTQTGTTTVTINKSMLKKKEMSASTVVMFANISLNNILDADGNSIASKTDLHIDDIADYSCSLPEGSAIITTLEGFNGFPMMGIQENVDLTPTSNQQNAIQVDLKILYAKVNFEIGVTDGTENTGTGMKFQLNSYEVFDAPLSTALAQPAATVSSQYDAPEKVSASDASIVTLNGTPLKFTFYVAENRYTHNANLANVYPSSEWVANPSPYDNLKQQYKPAVASASTADGNPTYVVISGKYTDYRGKEWTVDYTVYLGKDNHANFDVDRNSEYTNILTIKGVRNNNSYTDTPGAHSVWIDHRVHLETTDLSKHVTITRETLIDSHIEVRPLRINLSGSNYVAAAIYLPSYPLDGNGRIIYNNETQPASWGQITEIAGGNNENWIAIENNNGTKSKGTLYCSNGKRKYFTTSLIEELYLENDAESTGILTDSEGKRYLALSDGDCAWIYFDENIATDQRRALIDVRFYTNNGSYYTESYYVYQSGLKEVGGYLIESYEEYLHSYDSDDKYPTSEYDLSTSPTDYTQQGLPWGMLSVNESGELVGYKLSDSHLVKSVEGGYDLLSERYDYYHPNDGSYYIFQKNDDASWSSVDKNTNRGLKFTARASAKDNMSIIDMETRPTSAYQYCLSKNKFHEDVGGDDHNLMIHWYLPDVYEMTAILNAANYDKTLKDFANGAYYWSSQPSFTTSALQVVDENDEYARAVSVTDRQASDIHRKLQHRIRCVRSTQGEYADMSERVPDGLGGLIKIPMTVKDNGFFNYSSWFAPLGEVPIPYPSSIPVYGFPKGDTDNNTRSDADEDFGGRFIGTVHYYAKNPLDMQNWGKVEYRDEAYYSMIHPDKWPGLTSKNSTPIAGDFFEGLGSLVGQDALAKLETSDKILERSVTVRSGRKITDMPDDVSSVSLDHNEGSSNLSINFDKGTNNNNAPKYEYYNENISAATKRVWQKRWNVPTYSPQEFPKQNPLSYPAPERSVTFDRNDVLDEIDDVINGFLNEVANKKAEIVGEPTITPVTTSSRYSYTRKADAETAGKNYFNDVINSQNEYTLISVETSSQNITLCNFSYTYQKYKRSTWLSSWKTDGNPITENGSLTENLYTYVINYKTPDGTWYRYQPGTGGWSDEFELSPEQVSIDPEKSNIDALTLYGGNTFTITALNGHKIKSIKLNYSGSNFVTSYGLGGLTYSRYLRLVDANKSLPNNNKQPDNMTYSPDGDKGWFKWSNLGTDNITSVTFTLVTYSVSTSLSVFGQTIPSTFEYASPNDIRIGTNGFDTPLVIDSFEIRLELEED